MGTLDSGQPIVAAMLTEFRDGAKKILRVAVSLGMQIPQGIRRVGCLSEGCMADYEASAGLIGRLKSGQALVVQAVDSRGQPISVSLPLADFAEAYGGPPSTDAKAF